MPAVVLGLTFLVIALSFAWPVHLFPRTDLRVMSPHWSDEAGNVYAVTAWTGWAHFMFAFRGQLSSLRKTEKATLRLLVYGTLLALATVALLAVRGVIGAPWFSAIVWIYFIDHFLKAEQTFIGGRTDLRRWISSYQPLFAFGWLSVVLLNIGEVNARPWILWIVSFGVAVFVLAMGGWRGMASGDPRAPLLSLFFIAEALVWGTVSRYGGPTFLAGVYVVHIAAGSYFHYLGSYFYAASRLPVERRRGFYLSVLVTNVALIAFGHWLLSNNGSAVLLFFLSPIWFTVWVGLHLVSSDVFPAIRTRSWGAIGDATGERSG